MTDAEFADILKVRSDGKLFHREGQRLEFKEQFNLAGLADYFRDFAAFANNRGGRLIFGVSDSPRIPVGLTPKSLQQFESVDPEKITNFLLEIFSGHVQWECQVFELEGKHFAAFEVAAATARPIIAKKDEGKDNAIRNGDIYFRYGGRTQRIRYYELQQMIDERITNTNKDWMDRVREIGAAGPSNAAILDLQASTIRKGDANVLVIDEDLTSKLKFIQKGQFVEAEGADALRLVGDVQAVNRVEVVKKIKENVLKEYPLSATELWKAVKQRFPDCKQHEIYGIIKGDRLKGNPNYGHYVFNKLADEEKFEKTGKVRASTLAIYKHEAVDYIVNVLKQGRK